MADPSISTSAPEHPSPGRNKVSLVLLGFGLLAAPIAWLTEELVLYGIASRVCRMKESDGVQTLAHVGGPWFWIVFGIALAVALAGLGVAIRNWRITRGEKDGSGHHLVQLGEGRSRFLAMCGVLVSGGFLVGFVFTLANLALAPLCGS